MNPSSDFEPFAESAAADAALKDTVEEASGGEGASSKALCVLVVDDEAGVIAALRRLLRRESFELLTAESAEEGLRLLETHSVQLVISDERMPGMTGIQFLREIRRRWPHTIRMILSGYSAIKTILEAVNEGAVYRFLTKPWNDDELKISIRRALEQYTLAEQNRRMAQEIAEQNERLRQLNEQLAQRVSDASAGLDVARRLLDFIDVGVLVIDPYGLIVSANQPACRMLAADSTGLLGASISQALPDSIFSALDGADATVERTLAGCFDHQNQALQWRAHRVIDEGRDLGFILTIWEIIPSSDCFG